MTDPQIVLTIAGTILLVAIVAVVRAADPDAGLPVADALDWNGVNRRKRDAKRTNEHLKLCATLFNNFGIALVIALFVAPVARGDQVPGTFGVVLALIIIAMLHIFAQAILRFWRSEE